MLVWSIRRSNTSHMILAMMLQLLCCIVSVMWEQWSFCATQLSVLSKLSECWA